MVPVVARDRPEARAGDAAHRRDDRRRDRRSTGDSSTASCPPTNSTPPSTPRSADRRSSRAVLALGKRAFYAQDQLPEAAAYDIAGPVMIETRRPTTPRKACAPFSRSGRRSGRPRSRSRRRRRRPPREDSIPFAPFRHRAYARSGPVPSSRTSARGWSRSRSASTSSSSPTKRRGPVRSRPAAFIPDRVLRADRRCARRPASRAKRC